MAMVIWAKEILDTYEPKLPLDNPWLHPYDEGYPHEELTIL